MLVYGKQTVLFLAQNYPDRIEKIYIAKELDKKTYNFYMRLGCDIQRVPNDYADQLSKSSNHQGILAEVKEHNFKQLSDLKKSNFILILVGLTDMGNIGSILRTAYALGIVDVIVSGNRNLDAGKIAKTSSGAFFGMNLAIILNIYDIINELKQIGFTLYGSDVSGKNLNLYTHSKKQALFVGSEDIGLSKRVLNSMDGVFKIEMKNNFNSLNVSNATAIFLDRMRNE